MGIAWEKTVKTIEILFLVGASLIFLHIISIVVLISTSGKLSLVPSWIWIELRVFAYPLMLILWFRLLSIITIYRLGSRQKKSYIYPFALSLVALVLALNSPAWYSDGAFPLLACAYIAQGALDARHLKPRRKRTARSASRHTVLTSAKHYASASVKPKMLPPYGGAPRFSRRKESKTNSMPASSSPLVGIWHSPADGKIATRLRTHLQPQVREEHIQLWDASEIRPGAFWQRERAQALRSVTVAIVLVSADLMACDAIACNELPQLLNRALTQGTTILLLHVSPCDITNSGLERFQPLNPPEKPLAKMGRADRDKIMAETTRIICQRLGNNP